MADLESATPSEQASSSLTPPTPAGEVTRLLHVVRGGDRAAFDRVFALVYDELRSVAQHQLRGSRDGQALHATELVNELYLKLVGQAEVEWQSRAHFYAIAARAMRQILVDLARRRNTSKRGGEWARTTLTGKGIATATTLEEILALDELLDQLEERQRQVVELRFYGGLREDEIAEVLGVSTRTVQREWVKARAWLYRALYPDDEG
jgi:RNA polymerase sigma factor (TIGR02999 family)